MMQTIQQDAQTSQAKPAIPVIAENIPPELKARPRWAGFRWRWNPKKHGGKGGWEKPPCQPNGHPAKSNDHTTWSTFEEVLAAYEAGMQDGLAYAFGDDDPFGFVDLDNHRDKETGAFTPEAKLVLSMCSTYAEVSPSGTGAKAFFRGKPLPGKSSNHPRGIEVFGNTPRWGYVTGQQLEDYPASLEPIGVAEMELLQAVVDGDGPAATTVSDVDKAREALEHLSPTRAEDYHAWLSSGMALHATDPSLCDAWDRWSQSCPAKYQDGECQRRWKSFGKYRGRGIGLASLIFWAKQDSPTWRPPWETGGVANGHAATGAAQQLYRNTDTGNARRFAALHRDRIAFQHKQHSWIHFDGQRWRVDDTGLSMLLAKKTVDTIWQDAANCPDPEVRKELGKWAQKSEGDRYLKAMLSVAQSELPVTTEQFDQNNWLLNCPNGTLDLRTGHLRQHRRDDYITKLCPTPFNPQAVSPRWEHFCDTVFGGDAELIAFVQRYFGYALTGEVTEDCLAIFWGDGANGKTTLINAILDTIGDYGHTAAGDLLLRKKWANHPTELAALWGKRFVVSSESDAERKFNEALVKRLTGRDRITARFCFRDFFEFTPTHKILLCTNHRPEIEGTEHAIWRRLVLVPFQQRFWDAEKGESGPAHLRADKSLAAKLAEDAPAILAWMVRGARQWQEQGLAIPPAVRVATQQYRNDSDAVGRFISECCTLGEQYGVAFSDLYVQLAEWCAGQEVEVPTKHAVGKRLKDLFAIDTSKPSRTYRGLRIGGPDASPQF